MTPRGSGWVWAVCGWFLTAPVHGLAGVEVLLASTAESASPSAASDSGAATSVARVPRIAPEYRDVTIPPNLAPLNLTVQESGAEYRLRVSGVHGPAIEMRQAQPQIRFPLLEWKALLAGNRGSALRWDVEVRQPAGEWVRFAPFETRVAAEEIDPYLVYRRFRPLYTSYRHMGIYQRHLESFEEKCVVRSESLGYGCVNCHTFQQGAPDRFAISFRGRTGAPTLLIQSNRIARIDTKMGYLSWHPNGRLLAFADNTITQFFHLAGPLNRDVFDPRANIHVFHVSERTVEKPAALNQPDRSENWPCWAPDGRHLYYCSAPALAFRDERNFRYDILRIPYDADQNRWGTPETLVAGAEHRFSANRPRTSPDGRFLVFTAAASGSFPLFHPESDLYLLRLDTRKIELLPINSQYTETWPCWSSNGRWLIFGSRALDGVFARVLITHVDAEARFSKPFVLPQEDPAYYETSLDNFNAPELVRGPVPVSEEDLVRAVNGPGPANSGPEANGPAFDYGPDAPPSRRNP